MKIEAKARYWDAAISALQLINEEAELKITKEELTYKIGDPSHVTFLAMTWPAKMFEKYEIDEERKLGLPVSMIAKIFKRFGKDDIITFGAKDNKLQIESAKKQFQVTTIHVDEDEKEKQLPKIPHAAEFEIETAVLKNLLADIQTIGDSILFSAKKGDEIIAVNSKAYEGNAKTTIENCTVTEDLATTYSISYLFSLVALMVPFSPNCVLKIGANKPLQILWKVDEMVLHFYQAPMLGKSSQ